MKRILILAAALFTVCTAFAQSEYNLQRRSLFEVLPVYSSAMSRTAASAATARGGCSTVSTRSSGGIPRNCF